MVMSRGDWVIVGNIVLGEFFYVNVVLEGDIDIVINIFIVDVEMYFIVNVFLDVNLNVVFL